MIKIIGNDLFLIKIIDAVDDENDNLLQIKYLDNESSIALYESETDELIEFLQDWKRVRNKNNGTDQVNNCLYTTTI